MTWSACPSHNSVYFDSSVHKICPACQNDKFAKALKMSYHLHLQWVDLAIALLEWQGLSLDSLSYPLADKNRENVFSKKAEAYERAKHILTDTSIRNHELLNFLEKNNLREFLRD